MIKKSAPKKSSKSFLRRYAVAITILTTLVSVLILEYFTMIPSRLVESIRPNITREENPEVCTKEYSPICGKDGKTYGNLCMARAMKVSVARFGACEENTPEDIPVVTPVSSNPTTLSGSTGSGNSISLDYSNTGVYQIYENKNFGYTLSLPKYAYYQGNPGTGGASHILSVGLSSVDITSLESAPVRIYFYPLGSSPIVEGPRIPVSRGTLVVSSEVSTNVKIQKIVDTILASAK